MSPRKKNTASAGDQAGDDIVDAVPTPEAPAPQEPASDAPAPVTPAFSLMSAPAASLCARCQHYDRVESTRRGYHSCVSFPRIPPWSLDGTKCEVGPVGGIPLGRHK